VLGLIEGVSDGLAGAARLGGGAIADDPERRRTAAVGGYTTTAVLSGLIGVATSFWQVGVLRADAWAARGLRVPADGRGLARARACRRSRTRAGRESDPSAGASNNRPTFARICEHAHDVARD
jgi:hypothetical protein